MPRSPLPRCRQESRCRQRVAGRSSPGGEGRAGCAISLDGAQKTARSARTSFSLPFAGRVVTSSAEVGQVISEAQPFGRAFSLDAIEATVPVSVSDLHRLMPLEGREAEIDNGVISHSTIVDRMSAELDTKTRFARIYLPVTDVESFPPGTFVDVKLKGTNFDSTFTLPESVVQIGDNIWVVEDGILVSTPLEIYARTLDGLVVAAFDYADGIVDGAIPGAYAGLTIRVANQTSASKLAMNKIEDMLPGGGE